MKQRQWGRLYRSTYGKPRPFTYVYLFLYLAFYAVYLGLQIGKFHVNDSTSSLIALAVSHSSLATYVLEYILMGCISIAFGLISPLFGWSTCSLILPNPYLIFSGL